MLIITDFDGTLADTFKTTNGIGVEEAYSLAIQDIFGNTGTEAYNQIEGLKNRAPGELVNDLLSVGKDNKLIKFAKNFHEKREDLSKFVAKGKGAGLKWNSSNPEATIAELLVLRKLQILMAEIGSKWPLPFDGVISFLQQCQKKDIKIVILSSGHELFVRKTFHFWGIECPEMITDDDLRGKIPYLSKPNPALIDMACQKFSGRRPIFYIGDDPVKDGQLAERSRVPFRWFNPSKKKPCYRLPKDSIEFQSWKELKGTQ